MAEIDPFAGMEIAAILVMVFFALLIFAAVYVYAALTMMLTAKRLKTKQPWLAWIPIANMVLLARMAKMHWWPVLLFIPLVIPFVNIVLGIPAMIVIGVFSFIWMWKICEYRHRPGWWVLLMLIPFFGGIWGFVMWGILAWGKK